MSDSAMEMVAHQLSDTQQLRRALAGLVDVVDIFQLGLNDGPLEDALAVARQALDDTSHEGWLRRLRQRHEARMAERYDDCQRNGRHLETRWSSNEPPQCTHCERLLNPNTPDGL